MKEDFRPLTGLKAIVAGVNHALGLKGDGSLWAWGQNFRFGQLGNGDAEWVTNPVKTILPAM